MVKMGQSVFCLAFLLALFSCKTRDFGEGAKAEEFRPINTAPAQIVNDIKLSLADNLSIPYTVEKKNFAPAVTNEVVAPEFLRSYTFKFGRISKETFVKLRDAYEFSLVLPFMAPSEVEWNSDREYFLEDFMPPAIQAFSGNRFLDEFDFNQTEIKNASRPLTTALENQENGQKRGNVHLIPQELGTNCWSTVWNIGMGSKDKVILFNAHQRKMGDAFFPLLRRFEIGVPNELGVSGLVKEDDVKNLLSIANRSVFEKNLQRGDLIGVQGTQGFLAHAFIYIDKNLAFEKSNFGSNFAYRFVPMSEIFSHYAEHGGDVVTASRLSRALPNPEVQFAATGDFLVKHLVEKSQLSQSDADKMGIFSIVELFNFATMFEAFLAPFSSVPLRKVTEGEFTGRYSVLPPSGTADSTLEKPVFCKIKSTSPTQLVSVFSAPTSENGALLGSVRGAQGFMKIAHEGNWIRVQIRINNVLQGAGGSGAIAAYIPAESSFCP